MPNTQYWADKYVDNKCPAEDAIAMIKPGQRIFIGSSCGEPQKLVATLTEMAGRFTDLEIVRLLSLETEPLSLIANKSKDQNLGIRSFYLGSAKTSWLSEHMRFVTPMNLSAVPRLFKTRRLPIDVALIQVSPPDDFGWLSLGVSVDIVLSAARSADLVIAQVNEHMPRVLGRSFIHVNDVDVFVEHDEPLITVRETYDDEAADTIGWLIRRLIDDGSTLQISPGTTPRATMLALQGKNDLGVHTQYLTPEIMHLYAQGVINNRKKGFNEGKIVASAALGDENLYEFINDHPAIEFHPSEYVNDPAVISRHHKMVSLNVGMAMDLTGQVAADALPNNHFSGVTGMLDFIRGAFQSEGGRSIILMPSTAFKSEKSRIVPALDKTAVVVPRGDVHYVATEYGVVNLFGKSIQERALAMVSIAHPDHRDALFEQAKELSLISRSRMLDGSIKGVYPAWLETIRQIDGQEVTIRPSKPVDERRIQEHFYNLDRSDVVARFFHEKTSFVRDEMTEISRIDYVKNLTVLALVGDFGFGRVVGVGEYLLNEKSNIAEVAFSVSREFQGKGLGRMLMEKLATAARNNNIDGLAAYTSRQNKGMVALFRTLSYEITESKEEEFLVLTCRFDQPLTEPAADQ